MIHLLSLLSLALSIACYSISQLIQHGRFKFSKGYYGFWDEKSYERKYKRNRDVDPLGYEKYPAPDNWYYRFFKIKYKEAFPLSATFLSNFTDGYHMCQSLSFLFLSLSFSLATSINFFLVWGGILLVHFVTYRVLQR